MSRYPGCSTSPTSQLPETAGDVATFDSNVRSYRAAGLCTPDAAVLAYFHALGRVQLIDPSRSSQTTTVHRTPCGSCRTVIASFPDDIPGTGWRGIIRVANLSERNRRAKEIALSAR